MSRCGIDAGVFVAGPKGNTVGGDLPHGVFSKKCMFYLNFHPRRPLVRVSLEISGLFLCVLVLVLAIHAQEVVIQVDTALVTIPVTVFDREGRYISGLRRQNFSILENGVEQTVVYFETTGQELTVFVLLDRSGSMAYHKEVLANAASIFVSKLRPDDRLIAASFANEVDVIAPLMKVGEMKKAIKIRNRPGDNNTMVYDAVDFAMKKLRKIPGRKAIILFSDGLSASMWSTAESNLRDAEEQEALIYTVQFDTLTGFHSKASLNRFSKHSDAAHNYMRQLPQKTGGRHFSIERITDLGSTFEDIANDLSRQYTLGYYPDVPGKEGERRKISVKVNLPNVAVRSRNEVIYKKSK